MWCYFTCQVNMSMIYNVYFVTKVFRVSLQKVKEGCSVVEHNQECQPYVGYNIVMSTLWLGHKVTSHLCTIQHVNKHTNDIRCVIYLGLLSTYFVIDITTMATNMENNIPCTCWVLFWNNIALFTYDSDDFSLTLLKCFGTSAFRIQHHGRRSEWRPNSTSSCSGRCIGLYIPPFPEFAVGDITTAGPRWERYIKRLERLFSVSLTDDKKKKDFFCCSIM
jgi:hypothetical protein